MSLRLLACLGLACLALPALAAEAVFPPGSRFGLEPPPGMGVSKRFTGFETPAGATVTFIEMPAVAFRDLSASFTEENLKNQAFTLKNRESMKLPGNLDGVLLSGEQAYAAGGAATTIRKWILLVPEPSVTGLVVAQAFPNSETEEAMRTTLASIRLRPALSLEEQIGALPFKIANRGGFRPVRVLAGNSVLFTDGPMDQIVSMEQPIMVLAQAVQPPPAAEQRDAFARAALYSNQTIKDFAIERSQAYRQSGADWHEIVARATDIPSGMPVVVAQTIRFTPDGYMRAVGVVRAENRDKVLPRFRSVVDSVEVK